MLQFVNINTEFNSMSDDLKGVNTNLGTAIYSVVPLGEAMK